MRTPRSVRDALIIIESFAGLVASPDPTIVLIDLAGLLVPAFSDECTVVLSDSDHDPVSRTCPPSEGRIDTLDADSLVRMPQLHTPVHGGEGSNAFCGEIINHWHDKAFDHTDEMIARNGVAQAVAVITRTRLAETAARAHADAENLRTALLTNRQIGAAIGVLMARLKVTEAAAFDMLRAASQKRHVKLREVALDVLHTGLLETA